MKSYFLLFITFFVNFAYANEIPMDLYYKGKLIEPICYNELINGDDKQKVNLFKCSKLPSNFEIVPDNPIDKDFIGYSYKYTGTQFPHYGYVYYKYLGKLGNNYAILTSTNTGGSGNFSSITLIKRIGNVLKVVRHIAGGDRCFGGIKTAKIVDGKLLFSKKLTAAALLHFYKVDKNNESLIESLPNCAICCYGLAHYEGSQLQTIELTFNDLIRENEGFVTQAPACFENIYHDYLAKNKAKLTLEELQTFVNQITMKCNIK